MRNVTSWRELCKFGYNHVSNCLKWLKNGKDHSLFSLALPQWNTRLAPPKEEAKRIPLSTSSLRWSSCRSLRCCHTKMQMATLDFTVCVWRDKFSNCSSPCFSSIFKQKPLQPGNIRGRTLRKYTSGMVAIHRTLVGVPLLTLAHTLANCTASNWKFETKQVA